MNKPVPLQTNYVCQSDTFGDFVKRSLTRVESFDSVENTLSRIFTTSFRSVTRVESLKTVALV